jgi:hypothetical protein
MKERALLLRYFTTGVLSVFRFAKPAIFPKETGNEKDAEKLGGDWINIGKDISKAYGKFKM